MYNDQLVYKVVILAFFGIGLWTEKVALTIVIVDVYNNRAGIAQRERLNIVHKGVHFPCEQGTMGSNFFVRTGNKGIIPCKQSTIESQVFANFTQKGDIT